MGRATNALRNPSYQTDRRVRLKIHRSKWGEQQLRSKIHRTKYIKTTSKMRPVRNDMGGHPGQVPCESSGATSISTRGSTWSGRVYEYIIVAEPPLSKRHRVSNVPTAGAGRNWVLGAAGGGGAKRLDRRHRKPEVQHAQQKLRPLGALSLILLILIFFFNTQRMLTCEASCPLNPSLRE